MYNYVKFLYKRHFVCFLNFSTDRLLKLQLKLLSRKSQNSGKLYFSLKNSINNNFDFFCLNSEVGAEVVKEREGSLIYFI